MHQIPPLTSYSSLVNLSVSMVGDRFMSRGDIRGDIRGDMFSES